MKKIVSFLCYFIWTTNIFGQNIPAEYHVVIKKADSLYKVGDYKKSGIAYSSAFTLLGNKGQLTDRYRAARSWALANVPDSAFDCLNRMIKKRYVAYLDTMFKENDFKVLHSDKRWPPLLDLFKLYTEYKVPEGWFIAGTPEDYNKYIIGVAKGAGKDSKNAATIKSIEKNSQGFGNLMQNLSPGKFLNTRVRMSGFMKTKDADWASFWFRVDQAGSNTPLSFDNMKDGKENRTIKGTTDWKRYEIVLDVPEKASNISFGAMLGGTGQVWFDNIKFEIVDKSVPVTDIYVKDPVNLDFEE